MMLIMVVLSPKIPKVKPNLSEESRYYSFFGYLLYTIEKILLFIIIKDEQRSFNV